MPKELKKIENNIELTPKESLLLRYYLDPESETFGNKTKSAIRAYKLDEATQYQSAGVIGHEVLKKLKNEVTIAMEQRNISLGSLLDTLEDGLNATKVISAINTNKNAGESDMDFIDVPDHAIRHKYMESAAEWLGIKDNKIKAGVSVEDEEGKVIKLVLDIPKD